MNSIHHLNHSDHAVNTAGPLVLPPIFRSNKHLTRVQVDWRLVQVSTRKTVATGQAVGEEKGVSSGLATAAGGDFFQTAQFRDSAMGKAINKAIAAIASDLAQVNLSPFTLTAPPTNQTATGAAAEPPSAPTPSPAGQVTATWLGTGSTLLFLQNPVRPIPLRNLLAGRTPAGLRTVVPNHDAPERIVAWQFTIAAPEALSARWAAADRTERPKLFAAHRAAVTEALARFDGRITGFQEGPPWEEYPTSIFATFRGLPTPRNTPQLQHTALFINVGFRPDRTAQTYTNEAVLAQAQDMDAAYQRSLLACLERKPAHSNRLMTPHSAEASPRKRRSIEPPAGTHHQSTPAQPIPPPAKSHDYGHSH